MIAFWMSIGSKLPPSKSKSSNPVMLMLLCQNKIYQALEILDICPLLLPIKKIFSSAGMQFIVVA